MEKKNENINKIISLFTIILITLTVGLFYQINILKEENILLKTEIKVLNQINNNIISNTDKILLEVEKTLKNTFDIMSSQETNLMIGGLLFVGSIFIGVGLYYFITSTIVIHNSQMTTILAKNLTENTLETAKFIEAENNNLIQNTSYFANSISNRLEVLNDIQSSNDQQIEQYVHHNIQNLNQNILTISKNVNKLTKILNKFIQNNNNSNIIDTITTDSNVIENCNTVSTILENIQNNI